jgi:hypothetical protein
MNEQETKAIQALIERSYIEGIHRSQDEDLIYSGFHRDFAMLVRDGEDIEKVDVPQWLSRIEVMKSENPELWHSNTSYHFRFVDHTAYAAAVKIDVYKGETHFSTDYMLLYKFEEGWKIVSKIFAIPA